MSGSTWAFDTPTEGTMNKRRLLTRSEYMRIREDHDFDSGDSIKSFLLDHIETAGMFAHETITLAEFPTEPSGLSRRDEFAKACMASIVSNPATIGLHHRAAEEAGLEDADGIAKSCVEYADALIAALDSEAP